MRIPDILENSISAIKMTFKSTKSEKQFFTVCKLGTFSFCPETFDCLKAVTNIYIYIYLKS